jgi:hypothetical protein
LDPISFARLWPEAVASVRRHADLLWPTAAAFFFLPQLLASRQINGRLPNQWFQGDDLVRDTLALALVLVSAIVGQLVVARIVAADGTAGAPFGQVLGGALALVPAALAAWLIRGIGIVTGFWLLVIPGLWLFTRLLLVVPLIATGTSDPVTALKASWDLTRDRAFRLFGMMALLFTGYVLLLLGIGGLSAAVGVIGTVAAGTPAQGWGVARWLVEMIGAGAAAAFDTFYAAFVATIMVALRALPRKGD